MIHTNGRIKVFSSRSRPPPATGAAICQVSDFQTVQAYGLSPIYAYAVLCKGHPWHRLHSYQYHATLMPTGYNFTTENHCESLQRSSPYENQGHSPALATTSSLNSLESGITFLSSLTVLVGPFPDRLGLLLYRHSVGFLFFLRPG